MRRSLPREARDDSQWPADPTRAYGVGSLPGRREGTRGNRCKPDWGGTNDGCPGVSSKPGSSCHDRWRLARRAAAGAEEALRYARELLALNPNDNQGVRCIAVNWLLEAGGNEEAAALAKG